MFRENDVIQGCLRKEEGAQYALFQQFSGRLMTICRRYACDQSEAEDMLQDAFIDVFRHIAQFKATGSLEGWMKRITIHAAIRVLQKKKIKFYELIVNQYEAEYADPGILSEMGVDDLLFMISQLPDGYRVVFNLFALEGYTHEQISELLHIKTATSRSQLSKARAMLQAKITSSQKQAR